MRRSARRVCFEPVRRPQRCCGAAGPGATVASRLLARRPRSGCRVREDFTGRGFGGVRLREAR